MRSSLFITDRRGFSLFISLVALKTTTSTFASFSTGTPTSTNPIISGQWYNTSQVLASVLGADPRADLPVSQLSCPPGGCDVPVRFSNIQTNPVPTASARSNDSLASELRNECVLWDDSCTGNKTAAAIQFFKPQNGTSQYLVPGDRCFEEESSDCNPEVLSGYGRLKSWMRSPHCKSVRDGLGFGSLNTLSKGAGYWDVSGNCCDLGVTFGAGNVDVYFWPDPDADTSCLSIIGNSVYPLEYGATTGTDGAVYWGCTTQMWGWDSHDFGELTYTNGDTYEYWGRTRAAHDFGPVTVTTAIIGAVNDVRFKNYLVNPWSLQPCSEPNVAIGASAKGSVPAALQARVHTLHPPSFLGKRNNSRASTAVSGTFTL